ncbi:hypothetical protein AAMO2058_001024000 [Amorphochlora amoebiformis]
MVEVYRHTVQTRYRARWCSVAAIWSLICFLALLFLPFLLAYSSYGFWKTEEVYTEQPVVEYQHKLAMLAQTSTGYLTFSNVGEYNQLAGLGTVRIPHIESLMDDPNMDGRGDYFNLTLTLPLLSAEELYSFSALIFFHVELKDRVSLSMTSLTSVSKTSNLPGRDLSVFGNLRFNQLYPLSLTGSRSDYTNELFSASEMTSIEDTRFAKILSQGFARNESLRVDSEVVSWNPGRQEFFKLSVRYRIPESTIRYIPGPGEVLKFSWIQYLALGVVVYFVLDTVLYWSFGLGLVDARRVVDGQRTEDYQF